VWIIPRTYSCFSFKVIVWSTLLSLTLIMWRKLNKASTPTSPPTSSTVLMTHLSSTGMGWSYYIFFHNKSISNGICGKFSPFGHLYFINVYWPIVPQLGKKTADEYKPCNISEVLKLVTLAYTRPLTVSVHNWARCFDLPNLLFV